jgi:hypothetical protein
MIGLSMTSAVLLPTRASFFVIAFRFAMS